MKSFKFLFSIVAWLFVLSGFVHAQSGPENAADVYIESSPTEETVVYVESPLPVAIGEVSYLDSPSNMIISVNADKSIVGRNGSSLKYHWSSNAGHDIYESIGEMPFDESGTFILSLVVTNDVGEQALERKKVSIGNSSDSSENSDGTDSSGENSCHIYPTIGITTFEAHEDIKRNKVEGEKFPITFTTNCPEYEIGLYKKSSNEIIKHFSSGTIYPFDAGDYYLDVIEIVDNTPQILESSNRKEVSLTDLCATIRELGYIEISTKETRELQILDTCIPQNLNTPIFTISGAFRDLDPSCPDYTPPKVSSDNSTGLFLDVDSLPTTKEKKCEYTLETTIEDQNVSTKKSETRVTSKTRVIFLSETTDITVPIVVEKPSEPIDDVTLIDVTLTQSNNGEFIIGNLSEVIKAKVYLVNPLFSKGDDCLIKELQVVEEDYYGSNDSFKIPLRQLDRYDTIEFRIIDRNTLSVTIIHAYREIVNLHFFKMSKNGCIEWKPDTTSQIAFSTLDKIRIYAYIDVDKLLGKEYYSVSEDEFVVNVEYWNGNHEPQPPFSIIGEKNVFSQPPQLNIPFGLTKKLAERNDSDKILMLNLIDLLDAEHLSNYLSFRFEFTTSIKSKLSHGYYYSSPNKFYIDILPPAH